MTCFEMKGATGYCLDLVSQSSINDLDRIKNERHVEKITCGMRNSLVEQRDIRRVWKI
jgi:hypothetical protein